MTHISEIVDIFMMLQSDYRLKQIFSIQGEARLNQYVEAWLILSVSDFQKYCDQDLVYDKVTQTFSIDLNTQNLTVLAQIMVKYWLEKEVRDVLQFRLTLQDHDFKTYSQAQNLDSKRQLLTLQIEEVDKLLLNYSYQHNVGWLTELGG